MGRVPDHVFEVNEDKCFGCGAGGNSVSFLMEKEHYSYPEALKYLAKKYEGNTTYMSC